VHQHRPPRHVPTWGDERSGSGNPRTQLGNR
jgi:hypothetical protein